MTRRVVYGVGLVGFLLTMALTLASIILPTWITWDTPTSHTAYGLHLYCTSLSLLDPSRSSDISSKSYLYKSEECRSFPKYSDCHGPTSSTSKHFCTSWRTASFLSTLSFVLSLVTSISFLVLLLGGKQKRSYGWKIVVGLVLLTDVAQLIACIIVGVVLGTEDRFKSGGADGWNLGHGFWAAAVSVIVQSGIVVGIIVAKSLLGEEGGYELIPDGDRDFHPRRERDRSGGWARW